MIRILLALLLAFPLAAQAPLAKAPSKASATPLDSAAFAAKVESYLRNLYAWGPSFKLTVATPEPSPVSGFYKVDVKVGLGDQSDTLTVYVSRDARYMFRADLDDMAANPFASVRAKLRIAGNPSRGPANAAVTVVEFGDFQCPTCRELYKVFHEIGPN